VELIAKCLGAFDLVKLGARPAPPDEPPVLVPDIRRLYEEVGWRPRLALEEGLSQTIAWWRYAQSQSAPL